MKQIVVSILAGMILGVLPASYLAYNKGIEAGVNAYHNSCFNTGGIVIDELGRAIGCQPLGVVPKEENKEFIKKSLTS